MSIVQIFLSAGIVAWPLLVFSLVAVALVIERFIFWSRLKSRQGKVVSTVLKLYRSEDTTAVIARLKQNIDLPICRIFLEALELEEPTATEFRLALEGATQAELPLLKRYNTIFQTFITASPLLGLLGTVLGLMSTFSSLKLGSAGGSNTTEVTGGISEALISTAMGITVALSVLIFANIFRSFYIRQMAFIQENGNQLELLYRRLHQKGGKSYASSR